MLKKLTTILALGVMASIFVGCAAPADDAEVNPDINTSGELPAKLQQGETAGGGGGAASQDEPSTSPD